MTHLLFLYGLVDEEGSSQSILLRNLLRFYSMRELRRESDMSEGAIVQNEIEFQRSLRELVPDHPRDLKHCHAQSANNERYNRIDAPLHAA